MHKGSTVSEGVGSGIAYDLGRGKMETRDELRVFDGVSLDPRHVQGNVLEVDDFPQKHPQVRVVTLSAATACAFNCDVGIREDHHISVIDDKQAQNNDSVQLRSWNSLSGTRKNEESATKEKKGRR